MNKQGTVIENLRNARFRVEFLDDSKTLICYLSGKMRQNNINVLIGDKVEVIVEADWSNGRIIRRLR